MNSNAFDLVLGLKIKRFYEFQDWLTHNNVIKTYLISL
jgi:hypothetical protein